MKATSAMLKAALAGLLLATGLGRPLAADTYDALKVYDQTTVIVTQNFYDQTFRGLPWAKMVAAYRSQLSETSDAKAVKKTLNELLSNLHASHTEFLSEADQEYWGIKSIFTQQIDGAPFPQIGAWFVRMQGHWYIRNVFEDSPAAKAGLVDGDEIIAVDGKPLEPVRSFAGPAHHRRAIEYRRSLNGGMLKTSVVPESRGVQSYLLASTVASQRIILKNGRRIGYFHLWSGTHPRFQEALAKAALAFSQNTDGMILDLRDGFGGSGPAYLNPFFDHDDEGHAIHQIYSKPMIALINDGTRSGKEGCAYILQHTGRARLVGSRTAGFFLGGRPFVINPGNFLLFLAVDGHGPPGVDIEGKGVAPDRPVAFSLPYSAGQDPQLEQALALL